jgi:hypothetical protein
MARLAGALGVPPVIIGKMVQTEPSDVAWLTPSDLVALGVVPLDSTSPTLPRVDETGRRPMDMARYCKENFGPKARAKALNRHDASSWRCKTRVGLVGIDLRRLCQQQYGIGYGYQLGDRFDAASWSCVVRR